VLQHPLNTLADVVFDAPKLGVEVDEFHAMNFTVAGRSKFNR